MATGSFFLLVFLFVGHLRQLLFAAYQPFQCHRQSQTKPIFHDILHGNYLDIDSSDGKIFRLSGYLGFIFRYVPIVYNRGSRRQKKGQVFFFESHRTDLIIQFAHDRIPCPDKNHICQLS
jgi:hypothetical protein